MTGQDLDSFEARVNLNFIEAMYDLYQLKVIKLGLKVLRAEFGNEKRIGFRYVLF